MADRAAGRAPAPPASASCCTATAAARSSPRCSIGTGIFGTFLSLTYYFQNTLHYSALKSGFAFVPFSLGIITGATLASRFLPRIGPRARHGRRARAWRRRAVPLQHARRGTRPTSSIVLPAELIVSLGMGLAFVSLSSTALIGVHPEDAGVASALVNSTQQTGGSMGAALINTIATTATASYLVVHGTLAGGARGRAPSTATPRRSRSAASCWRRRPWRPSP